MKLYGHECCYCQAELPAAPWKPEETRCSSVCRKHKGAEEARKLGVRLPDNLYDQYQQWVLETQRGEEDPLDWLLRELEP